MSGAAAHLSDDELRSLPADQAPTAVLDLETTGLYPEEGHRIIEVAVVRAMPGEWDKPERHVVYQSLVDPGRTIPARSIAIHGIEDHELEGQPSFPELRDRIAEALEGAVFVAQNAPFDLGFLEMECERAGLRPIVPGPVVDTLLLGRHVFGLPRNSLSALAERTGVPQPLAHRALADAQTTLGVYAKMLASLARPDLPTVGELQSRIETRMKGGVARLRLLEQLQQAADHGSEVVIDYTAREGPGELITRRRIKVSKVRTPYIEAWCFLRGDERVFRLGRIQRLWRAEDAPAMPASEAEGAVAGT